MQFSYHIGGSLTPNDPSYICRLADESLNTAVAAGEFCYVFNSRQMGKSSLLARTQWQFLQQGYACITLDLTRIGGEITTPTQWYKGIVLELWRGLKLRRELKLKEWWQEAEDISLLQNLSYFVEREILGRIKDKKIVIFIDEIDSVISLKFPVDDLFALIRFCYNQRGLNSDFERLTFVLFGVAKPTDLIQDRTRTPFNIGRAIELGGLPLDGSEILAQGFGDRLADAQLLLQEIFRWTGGQPFLTQKLCQLVRDALGTEAAVKICRQNPVVWLEKLVRDKVIERWDAQDDPEHLRTIRDRLLWDQDNSGRLLGLYQQILQGETVALGDIDDLSELLLSGLVVRQGDRFTVKNPIYAAVFNQQWVDHALQQLRPYAQTLQRWLLSEKSDSSRLLRGQTLIDAQTWATGKRLSDEDYQFLAASVEGDRQLREQALEAARTGEMEARLEQEQRNTKLQRILLSLSSGALILVSALSLTVGVQYSQTVRSERRAQIGKIEALIAAANSTRLANDQLESMTAAIAAKETLMALNKPEELTELSDEVDFALSAAIYNTTEKNQWAAHDAGVNIARMSPDGQLLATAGRNGNVKLWTASGQALITLDNHRQNSLDLAWSDDSQILWTISLDGMAIAHKIQFDDDAEIRVTTATTITEDKGIFSIALSPDNEILILGSIGKLIGRSPTGALLWQIPLGRNLVWDIAFSPDGQDLWIPTQNTIKGFTPDGEPLPDLLPADAHNDLVFAIAISPDGQTIATGSNDGVMKLWNRQDGRLLATMSHAKRIWDIAFSPDGQTIATSTDDGAIALWTTEGKQFDHIKAHRTTIRNTIFSTDGKLLISASRDGTVKLWQWEHPFRTVLQGHTDNIRAVAWHNDSQQLATGSSDQSIRLWSLDGRPQQQIDLEKGGIWALDFQRNTDNNLAISSGAQIHLLNLRENQLDTFSSARQGVFTTQLRFTKDGQGLLQVSEQDILRWDLTNGNKSMVQTLSGHTGQIQAMAIAQDATMATGGDDQTLRLWQMDGKPDRTIRDFDGGIRGLAFVPKTAAIASVTRNGTFQLWDSTNGKIRHNFEWPRRSLEAIAVRPDGELFAVGGGDRSIELWTMTDQKPQLLPLHQDSIFNLQFSPDGKYLASGSADSNAIIWHIDAIRQLDPLTYACNWAKDYILITPENPALCNN
ncbi:MAG: hypothetical protein HC799_12260 [Limnothrix sp. RL_2_0]|nr:hypothetical protein [Limnothrix sp. RL_2_0]